MAKLDRIEHIVTIPEGVTASISEDGVVTITGPKGSLSRTFVSGFIDMHQDGSGIVLRVDLPRRKQKALVGTWNAHLNNMVKGVTEGFTYHLKAFYSHFPMTLAVNGDTFTVNNYFGERVPRTAEILHNVNVSVQNKVESPYRALTRNWLAKQQPTLNDARPSRIETDVSSRMVFTC